MCPLEKGVREIETRGSGYLRQQIREGRKGRAERQGLGQSLNENIFRGIETIVLCSGQTSLTSCVLAQHHKQSSFKNIIHLPDTGNKQQKRK